MSKKRLVTLALSLVLTLGLFANTGLALTASAAETDKTTIEITGTGTVKAAPDTAKITLGVKTQGKKAEQAQKENAEEMDKVIKAIKAKGVKEEKIQTISYTIYPTYQYIEKEGKREISGYEVNNSIEVTITNLDNIANVIDAAVASGVNVTNNIQFYLENQEQYYYEALSKAILDAKSKAEIIAKVLNVEIAKPQSIIEMGNYNNYPIYFKENLVMDMSATSGANYIQAQEIEIKAEVKIIY